MLQTMNQAVNSANAAAIGMHQRNIQNITNIHLEEMPLFSIILLSRTFHLDFNFDTYYLEEFDLISRPKGFKYIYEIDQINETQYTLTCRASATSDQIYAELERLVLPF